MQDCNLPGIIYQCLTTPDGALSFPYVSDSCERLLGISAAEVAADPELLWAVLYPDDRGAIQGSLRQALAAGTPWRWEGRFLLRSGQVRWMHGEANPTPQGDGSVLWSGLMMDMTEQKAEEAALAAERDRLWQASPDLLVVMGFDGQCQWVNPAVTRVLGYEPEEFVGCPWRELVHRDDWAVTVAELERLASGGKGGGGVFENRYRTKGDGYCWMSWKFVAVPEEGVVYASGRDVTHRKRAEKDLLRYKYAVESASDAIAIADGDGQHLYHNAAFARLLETPSVEAFRQRGGTASTFCDPAVAEAAIAAIRSGQAWSGEVTQRSCNDNPLEVFLRASAITDPQGTAVGQLFISSDITGRRRASRERRQLAALIEHSADFIALLSLDGTPLYINPAGLSMVGLEDMEAARLKHLDDFFEVEDRAIARNLIYPSVDGTGQWQGEFRFWHFQRQRTIPVDFHLFTIRQPETGEPLCLATITRNASERKAVELALRASELQLRQQAADLEETLSRLKQTQTQLIHQEKMSSLGQLVAGVAHEINNPVSFIYGNVKHAQEYTMSLLKAVQHLRAAVGPLEDHPELEAALDALDLDYIEEDLPHLLASMQVGADRIKGIVKSLRTFSRMDEADLKGVDLHDGLDSTLLILQHRLKGNGDRPSIDLVKRYGPLPTVECYPGLLNQVFMNVLTNAIDALEESGVTLCKLDRGEGARPRIEIETRRSPNGDRVIVAISDNGPGIPESIRRNLFDPFFTTKDVGKGTGLGLSISYQIVTEQHRGRLECQSQPGVGTTFEIEVPLVQKLRSPVNPADDLTHGHAATVLASYRASVLGDRRGRLAEVRRPDLELTLGLHGQSEAS